MKAGQKEYFDYLYNCLEHNSLLPQKNMKWRIMFQSSFDYLEIDSSFIRDLYSEVGIGFENVFLVNARKAVLARGNYIEETAVNRESTVFGRTAVYFSVLGCVLDYMIDHGTEQQRKQAVDYLKWDKCSYYFQHFERKLSGSVIDRLYECVGQGLMVIKKCNPYEYLSIINMIRLASGSELYVSGEDSDNMSMTDKSVLFITTALRISVADICVSKDCLFENIAEAFQIIDDVCDVFEDEEAHHANIILGKINSSKDWRQVIDEMILKISCNLKQTESICKRPLYDFVISEIREWSMSCKYIKEKVWENG